MKVGALLSFSSSLQFTGETKMINVSDKEIVVPGLYYAEREGGFCTVFRAASITQAKKIAREDQGTHYYISVRHATKYDVDWFEMMGGYLD